MLMIQKVIDEYAELVTDEQQMYRTELTESIEEQVKIMKKNNYDEISRRKNMVNVPKRMCRHA